MLFQKRISRIVRICFALAWAAFCAPNVAWAAEDPVTWTLTLNSKSIVPGGTGVTSPTADVQSGCHVYSLTRPEGGPNPPTIRLADNSSVASVRIFQPRAERKIDPDFVVETDTFEKQLPLRLEITATKDAKPGPLEVTAQVRYQCCSSTLCLPPRRKTAQAILDIDPSAKTQATDIPALRQRAQARHHILLRNRRAVHDAGASDEGHCRSFRDRIARREPLGKRIDRACLRDFRAESTRSL